MFSNFKRVADLIGKILGLQNTSLRVAFSLYTRPALGKISLICLSSGRSWGSLPAILCAVV
jgi:hypothetical protein